MPWLFHRFERSQGPFKNRLRFPVPVIIHDPKLGPAFDGRQLTGRGRQIKVLGYGLDPKRRQNVLKMTDHQRIFGGEYSAH